MKRAFLAAILASLAAQAGAVGLGPLTKQGTIDGPAEAFYLTLYNPYAQLTDFVAYAVGEDDETPQARVTVYPDVSSLGGERSRQIMIIANDLAVGETYHFRVCAQRRKPPEGILINARVCSKITARRVG